ncbi:MAG: tetratricopeptide repeat protein [candidate division NC10 bacterium]|nr:tetratricopeptide repeat protein [candidate division NC10 bacterium]
MGARWWFILGGLFLLATTGAFAAQAGEPVAVLTEIRVGQGEVRVKSAAEAEWKAPLPLLSLRPGDQIRATRNATVVLMFTGGQGTLTVSAGNSPYTVQAPAAGAAPGKTPELLAHLSRVLMGKKKELSYVPLAVRSVKQPPLLLSPRDGKLLGPPALEWAGSDRARYAVRLFGPQGLVWEQANLPRAPLPYPASAPQLRPGVVYRWELETRGFPAQQGQFTILPPAESAPIRQALATLDPAGMPNFPKNTVTLMRAGFLFEQELYAEARNELQAAIAADPDEPSLHLMLGHVYERTGLAGLAAEEFDEAQFLSTRTP